jgi:5-bromo-4-chloroindolyl phosphate hydrolysis protein.
LNKRNDKNKGGAAAAAFLAAAAVWLVWALLFPMYSAWHFALPLAFSVLAARAVFRLIKRKYPQEEEPEPEPEIKSEEEFKSTGNPELDSVLKEGKRAVSELGRLYAAILSPDVKQRVLKIIDISDKIIKDAAKDPSDIPQIKRFLNFYMPTTIKLLNEYDRMYSSGINGKNISGSMNRIESALDSIAEAYARHYDSLFNNENLDIETDIKVLEGLLKREGLGESDFNIK